MILLDANLLLHARVSDLPQHKVARAWLDGRLTNTVGVGLPWPSLLALVRLVSNPRTFRAPMPVEDAGRQVDEWLESAPA